MGSENLIPFNNRTESEQREIAKKGGRASGSARRKKANLKRAMNMILTTNVNDEQMAEVLHGYGMEDTFESAVVLRMIRRILEDGDPAAYKAVMDTIREKEALDVKEQRAKIEKIKADTAKIKGTDAELEDISDIEAKVYDA